MGKNSSVKYDLEERTFQFAREVRSLVNDLSKNIANYEDGKQVVRSSGSVGANYIEANESLSEKDFIFRVKISRKEAKETIYWLRLLSESNNDKADKISELIQEATELKNILSAIIKRKES